MLNKCTLQDMQLMEESSCESLFSAARYQYVCAPGRACSRIYKHALICDLHCVAIPHTANDPRLEVMLYLQTLPTFAALRTS